MRSALADDFTKIVLRIAMFGNQLIIAHGFFDRVEIGPLNVFDDGELQRCPIVDVVE